jgi:hypothetical protein
MALPPENRTPRMEALQAIINRTPRKMLANFPNLQPEDHQIVGLFVQIFNYMDFNLRRSIETFAYAKLLQGESAKKYPKIHSSIVAEAVQQSVQAMDPALEDIPEALRILHIIERRREIRNLLGHWAARRIPNEDSIVLLSKDERDAMQTGGAFLANGQVKSAIMDLADLRGIIINELIPFDLWLAKKTSEWRARYVGD